MGCIALTILPFLLYLTSEAYLQEVYNEYLALCAYTCRKNIGSKPFNAAHYAYKPQGARYRLILSFAEILLWVFVASNVLADVKTEPIKGLLYAAGFTLGNFFGSKIEERLALGVTKVEAIVSGEHAEELIAKIRNKGFAVTVVEGRGRDDSVKKVLFMSIRRKEYKELCEFISSIDKKAFITAYDITPVHGGYGIIRNDK